MGRLSRGGRERVRNNDEQVYYFFVDGWGEEPKVCLMERAVKHAKVLAEADVPPKLVRQCVESQGRVARFERSYAVDEPIKAWLIRHIVEQKDSELKPIVEKTVRENMGPPLVAIGQANWNLSPVTLPAEPAVVVEEDLSEIIQKWNFYDGKINPKGLFANCLTDSGDGLTVVDERTNLQWQAGGIDICSSRTMQRKIEELNSSNFGGYSDWRLPSLEEAMSLMEPIANFKGIHLHPCFSMGQPFIFVAAQRKPGGYWFVDYKHGRAFWSSGTIPGGFGQVCRSRK